MQKGIDFIGITVCYFCHDGEGNYLLNLRSKNCRDEHGRWDFGGGGLEFDQNVEECLKQEILEEYCTPVLEHEFLGYRDFFRETPEGKKTHWVALDFKVLVDREKVKNGEPNKFDKVEWFKAGQWPDPLHSQSPIRMGKYTDKLI